MSKWYSNRPPVSKQNAALTKRATGVTTSRAGSCLEPPTVRCCLLGRIQGQCKLVASLFPASQIAYTAPVNNWNNEFI